jgi:signal transduction histidine kinase
MRAHDPEFNVTIQKDYDPSVGPVTVIPQDLSRVFLNIIANSFYEVRRKSADGAPNFLPTLSVTTKNLGQVAEVRIRDNGNGIPEHIRDKVFSPFFTTKAAGEGTGLGLSLSYDIIVKGHRGDLRFETEYGQFTEFIIRLPREV